MRLCKDGILFTMARQMLEVKFLGANFDKMISSVLAEIEPKNWQRKKNLIINKSLKDAARSMLPIVWAKMRVGDTKRMRMFTSIHRLDGGGWRISAPRRRELDNYETSFKGYYPAAMEFGFSHKGGQFVAGNHAMGNTMIESRGGALRVMKRSILSRLRKVMSRHKNSKISTGRRPTKDYMKNFFKY